MAIWGAIILDVVKQAVRDLEDSLIGNVLVGLNAKFDALESLRQLIHKLLLYGTLCGRVGSHSGRDCKLRGGDWAGEIGLFRGS